LQHTAPQACVEAGPPSSAFQQAWYGVTTPLLLPLEEPPLDELLLEELAPESQDASEQVPQVAASQPPDEPPSLSVVEACDPPQA
jgi:hypothetical protein